MGYDKSRVRKECKGVVIISAGSWKVQRELISHTHDDMTFEPILTILPAVLSHTCSAQFCELKVQSAYLREIKWS